MSCRVNQPPSLLINRKRLTGIWCNRCRDSRLWRRRRCVGSGSGCLWVRTECSPAPGRSLWQCRCQCDAFSRAGGRGRGEEEGGGQYNHVPNKHLKRGHIRQNQYLNSCLHQNLSQKPSFKTAVIQKVTLNWSKKRIYSTRVKTCFKPVKKPVLKTGTDLLAIGRSVRKVCRHMEHDLWPLILCVYAVCSRGIRLVVQLGPILCESFHRHPLA